MVLVFLKNLIFPSNSSRRGVAKSIAVGNDSPPFKYGSIGPAGSTPPSPLPGSGTGTPSHGHDSNVQRDSMEGDIEQGLGLGFPSVTQDNMPLIITDTESLGTGSDFSEGQTGRRTRYLSPRVISDAIIGLSDGLTVPFALTAGLSTFNDTRVVVYGGLAELIAGSISMGLGGWLAARGESEYYQSTVAHTDSLISAYRSQIRSRSPSPGAATPTSFNSSPIPQQVNEIFTPYSLPAALHSALVAHLLSPDYPRDHLLGLLIRHHHNLSPPESHRAHTSALTIATGYFLGGFVPLLPYFFVGREEVLLGLIWSVGVMGICLFFFGAWKTAAMDNEGWDEDAPGAGPLGETRHSGSSRKIRKALRGGVEMVMVGGVAAGGAMGIVRFLGGIGE